MVLKLDIVRIYLRYSMSNAEYTYPFLPLKLCMITQLPLDCDIVNVVKRTLYQCSVGVIEAPPIGYLFNTCAWVPESSITYMNYNYHISSVPSTNRCEGCGASYLGYTDGAFTYRFNNLFIRAFISSKIRYIKEFQDGIVCYLL